MNEVFRRRLIGLAVLLVLLFVLSLFLPKDDVLSSSSGGDAPSTTVSLGDVEIPAPAVSAPIAAASQDAVASGPQGPAERPVVPAPPAPAISDLTASAPEVSKSEAAPKAAAEKHLAADVPAQGASSSTLKLSPTVSAQNAKSSAAAKSSEVVIKPVAPKAAEIAKPEPPLSPPKPKLAESVAKAPVASPSPVVSPQAAGWYVQLGSFSDPGKAETIISLLQKVGYKAESSKVINNAGVTLYRVRLGVFSTEAAARQAQEKVSKQGYPQSRVVSEGPAGK